MLPNASRSKLNPVNDHGKGCSSPMSNLLYVMRHLFFNSLFPARKNRRRMFRSIQWLVHHFSSHKRPGFISWRPYGGHIQWCLSTVEAQRWPASHNPHKCLRSWRSLCRPNSNSGIFFVMYMSRSRGSVDWRYACETSAVYTSNSFA